MCVITHQRLQELTINLMQSFRLHLIHKDRLIGTKNIHKLIGHRFFVTRLDFQQNASQTDFGKCGCITVRA